MNKKPILITPGEPSGIGPDVVIKLTQKKLSYPYKIIADPNLMLERAEQLKLKFDLKNIIPLYRCHSGQRSEASASRNPEKAMDSRVRENDSKKYVLESLKLATKLCVEKKAAALITGPVNKKIINDSGVKFQGHTQYLAKLTKTKDVVMYFESPILKIALVTDHIPLSEVPRAITKKRLIAVINILNKHLHFPKIAVCGLNPHAGEGGYLGQEEIKIITPVIQKYPNLFGPFSADSLFTEKNLKKYDMVLAMYHDQGLSVLKHRSFGKSINITLGLSFIRTSVDHGTAIELAGTGKADASSLEYVFKRTVELIHGK